MIYHNIGIDYQGLGQHDRALEYLEESLNIRKRCLTSKDPNIARTLASIGRVYVDQNNLSTALIYFQQASDIFREAFGDTSHPCIVQTEEEIRHIKSQSMPSV